MSRLLVVVLAGLTAASCSEPSANKPAAPTTLTPVDAPAIVAAAPSSGSPAGGWGRPRLDLWIATPEDVPGLEGCIAATIATDDDRTAGRMGVVEETCIAEAPEASTPQCEDWAQTTHKIASKFAAFSRDASDNAALQVFLETAKEDEPAAIACNASLQGTPG